MAHPCGRLVAATAACALVFAQASVAPAAPPRELGAATPQALVERMKQAAAKKDFAEVVACLDPDSRKEMTLALMMGTTMMVAFMGMGSEMASGMADAMSDQKQSAADKAKADKQKAEATAKVNKAKAGLSAIFKKHGLPDLLDEKTKLPQEEGAAEKMLAKVDQPALAGDLIGFMDAFGDKKPGEGKDTGQGGPMDIPEAVTDYKIAGDSATAKAGKDTLQFVKIDGRWLFKPEDKKKEGQPEKK